MESPYLQFKNLCESRKSCRKFKSDVIPPESIEDILTIAKKSPYAGGSKNWGISVLNDKNLINSLSAAIAKEVITTSELMDREGAELFIKYSQNFHFFKEAPLILIPYFKVSSVMTPLLRGSVTESLLQWERDNSVKSISCVSMIILLAAESLGLGACYMTGPLIAGKKISEIAKIPPGREPGAIIPIGYPLQ
jgi:nitroreductase